MARSRSVVKLEYSLKSPVVALADEVAAAAPAVVTVAAVVTAAAVFGGNRNLTPSQGPTKPTTVTVTSAFVI